MSSWRRACLGLWACAVMMVAHAAHAAAGWEPIQQGAGREDVSTWVRPVEGLPVKAFRGQTEVPRSVFVVLALLADTRNLANWVFQGQFSEHPANLPNDHIYMRFSGVWPADDRDVLFRTTIRQQGDAIVVDSVSTANYPVNPNFVRMAQLHNTFRLTPLKAGWTRIEFETFVDLGGWVPAWIANMVSTKAPLVTLGRMREQLKKPKYQIKSAAELPADYPVEGKIVVPDSHFVPAAP